MVVTKVSTMEVAVAGAVVTAEATSNGMLWMK